MANTSDSAEQAARDAMTAAIDFYARLTGYLDDDYHITAYVVATEAENLDAHHETGCITSHPMPSHEIHGLLDWVDQNICAGTYYTSDDEDLADGDL